MNPIAFQQSYWYTAQVVTAVQMTAFSQDIYQRISAITGQNLPCILQITSITQGSGNVVLGGGYFAFSNATYSYLPYNTGIFGYAPPATVSVSGDGYIVARYSVTPNTMNQTNYSFPAQYLFITGTPAATDCVVCTITSGIISGYGPFLNFSPDIIDNSFAGLVSIIGAGGLNVTKNSIFSQISARGGLIIFGNAGSVATAGYIGSNATGAGGYNGIVCDDRFSSPVLNNWTASIGDTVNTIATQGFVKDSVFTNNYSAVVGIGTINLNTISYNKPFPANVIRVSGSFFSSGWASGLNTITLDLDGVVGVLSGNATQNCAGPLSTVYAGGSSGTCTLAAGTTILTLNVGASGGSLEVAFSLDIF